MVNYRTSHFRQLHFAETVFSKGVQSSPKCFFLITVIKTKTFLNCWVALFLSTSFHKNKKVNVICTFVTDIMYRLCMYLFVKASSLPFGNLKHMLWQLISYNIMKPSRNLRDFSSSWTDNNELGAAIIEKKNTFEYPVLCLSIFSYFH